MTTTCYGKGAGQFHIAPGGGFFANGMCCNSPVDAAQYPNKNKLYVYANVSGYSSPNIRTILSDGTDNIKKFNRGDYCWLYWDWDGADIGNVEFELRDGNVVKARRTTKLTVPPVEEGQLTLKKLSLVDSHAGRKVGCTLGICARWFNNTNMQRYFNVTLIVDGVDYTQSDYMFPNALGVSYFKIPFNRFGNILVTGADNPDQVSMRVKIVECYSREKPRDKKTCDDGSVIYQEVCSGGEWVPSGESCPIDPCKDVVCTPECFDHDLHNTVCKDGVCVKSTLIDADNIETCKYDPCIGVTCPPKCFDHDLHNMVCKGGSCIKGDLIESNSAQCDYVPPEPEPDEPTDEPTNGEPDDYDLPDEPTEPRSPIDQLSELLKLKPSLVIVGIILLLFFMMRR